jgi:hypothetical protein
MMDNLINTSENEWANVVKGLSTPSHSLYLTQNHTADPVKRKTIQTIC